MALTVLVVDDSQVIRERLVGMLRSIDGVVSVEQAPDLAGGRRWLARRWPDVIVLDIALPDGSGIDLLRAVKRSGPPLLAIMLTNYPSLPYRKRCLAAGGDYFLDKSTEFERLSEIVGRFASRRGDSK